MQFFGADLKTTALALITIIDFALASLIYLRSKLKSSIYFALAVVGVGIWATGINFYIQPGITPFTYFWSNMNYMMSTIFSLMFFLFAYYFGSEDRVLKTKYLATLIGIMVFVIILILHPGFSPSVVISVNEIFGTKAEIFGWGYPFFAGFLFFNFGVGLAMLIKKYVRSDDEMLRSQLKYIILGTGLAIVLGILTNILLPSLGIYGTDWVGPFSSLVFVSYIAYAITKHNLWDFRLIAIELFTALMILILLLQVFVAEGYTERIVKGIVFGIVSVLAFYLIKGMLREVDLREEMETLAQKLSVANQRLREIDIEKSDFVSITGHQLRSPLTAVKGYASMLLEGSFGRLGNKEQVLALDKIFQASQRLVLVIQEFTDISKIEKGEMEYSFKRVDLKDVLRDAIDYFKTSIREEKLSVTLRVNLGEKYEVEGDREKLDRVFRNILDNAVKYTPPGGSIVVTITELPKEGVYHVSIKDSGIGIQKEMMPRLFEKFSRAEASIRLHTEGRGLGLFIAKLVVNAHRGTIWAESNGHGKGSTFYVALPSLRSTERRREIKSFLETI